MNRRHFFSIVSTVATGILVVVKGYGQRPRTVSSSPDTEASASKKCGMPEATDADVTFERGKLVVDKDDWALKLWLESHPNNGIWFKKV